MTNAHLHIGRLCEARRGVYVALAGVLAAVAPTVSACTVCYGETDNAYLRGAEQATLFLVGVTYVLLLGGVGAFLALRRRARRRLADGVDEKAPGFEGAPSPPAQRV